MIVTDVEDVKYWNILVLNVSSLLRNLFCCFFWIFYVNGSMHCVFFCLRLLLVCFWSWSILQAVSVFSSCLLLNSILWRAFGFALFPLLVGSTAADGHRPGFMWTYVFTSLLPLEPRPDSLGESGMHPRDPYRPWRGTLGPGHKPRWGLFWPAVTREQFPPSSLWQLEWKNGLPWANRRGSLNSPS